MRLPTIKTISIIWVLGAYIGTTLQKQGSSVLFSKKF